MLGGIDIERSQLNNRNLTTFLCDNCSTKLLSYQVFKIIGILLRNFPKRGFNLLGCLSITFDFFDFINR